MIYAPSGMLPRLAGTGVARSASQSQYPGLWRELRGYWSTAAGPNSLLTLKDWSGRGNDGTINGSMLHTAWTVQRNGLMLDYDGSNDYTSIANEADFDFERTDAFSIAGWCKSDTATTASSLLFGKSTNASPYTGIHLGPRGDLTGDPWEFQLINTVSTNAITIRAGTADNNLHHIAATYDGSSSYLGASIYIDGMLQTVSSFVNNLSASILNNITPNIGSRNGSTSPGIVWNGLIGDLGVWKRLLNPSEVMMLAMGASPLVPIGLITGKAPSQQTASAGTGTVVISGFSPSASGTGTGAATPGSATVAVSGVDCASAGTGTGAATSGSATVAVTSHDLVASGTGASSSTPGAAIVAISGASPAATPQTLTVATDAAVVPVTGVDPSSAGTGTGLATPGSAIVVISAHGVDASGGISGVVVGWIRSVSMRGRKMKRRHGRRVQ